MKPSGRRPPVRLGPLPWLVALGSSVGIHYFLLTVMEFVHVLAPWLGIPCEWPFTLGYHNPFLGTGSAEDKDSDDGVVVIVPSRRPRPLPELERPSQRDGWDSRKVPVDESLGIPSPIFDRPFRGATNTGWNKAKGDSIDYVSDKPFRSKGTYDVLGPDAGAGGRYGSSIVLLDPVQRGLLWLARHQADDGSWSEESLAGRCGRTLPNGRAITGPPCEGLRKGPSGDATRTTALALLAFGGAGYSSSSQEFWDGLDYRAVLERSSRFLSRSRTDPESRVWALLALALLMSRRSPFEAPAAFPDAGPTADLLSAVEADPPCPEESEEAVWRALSIVAAAGAGLNVSSSLLDRSRSQLARRVQESGPLEAGRWPGENPTGTYLKLLASFERTSAGEIVLPGRQALEPLIREGQVRDPEGCAEGSWNPAPGGERLLATVLHLLALEAMPGYGSRLGYPPRSQ